MPPSIPSNPGSYALQLSLADQQELQVGRLGMSDFPPGEYVYLGSALGPGGLKARLGRHLRGNGPPHWHIDWLRARALVTGYHFLASNSRLECDWSQALINHQSTRVPVHGFGSSDCRGAENPCPTHLVWLKPGTHKMTIRDILTQVSGTQVTYRKFTSDSQSESVYIE
jgi:Uri superfamily endonuclease